MTKHRSHWLLRCHRCGAGYACDTDLLHHADHCDGRRVTLPLPPPPHLDADTDIDVDHTERRDHPRHGGPRYDHHTHRDR